MHRGGSAAQIPRYLRGRAAPAPQEARPCRPPGGRRRASHTGRAAAGCLYLPLQLLNVNPPRRHPPHLRPFRRRRRGRLRRLLKLDRGLLLPPSLVRRHLRRPGVRRIERLKGEHAVGSGEAGTPEQRGRLRRPCLRAQHDLRPRGQAGEGDESATPGAESPVRPGPSPLRQSQAPPVDPSARPYQPGRPKRAASAPLKSQAARGRGLDQKKEEG